MDTPDMARLKNHLRGRSGDRETLRLTGLRLRDRLRRRRAGVLLRRLRGGLPLPLLRRGGVGDLHVVYRQSETLKCCGWACCTAGVPK